jgi:hypothetical protein
MAPTLTQAIATLSVYRTPDPFIPMSQKIDTFLERDLIPTLLRGGKKNNDKTAKKNDSQGGTGLLQSSLGVRRAGKMKEEALNEESIRNVQPLPSVAIESNSSSNPNPEDAQVSLETPF